MTGARERARQRRERTAEAERGYETFLDNVATPVTKHVVTALRAEAHSFTLFTPAGGLRLADDRGRDDYVELFLDSASDPPQVVGRVRYTRGSRTITEERPIKSGAAPDALSEEDVLAFLLEALAPLLER